MPIKPLRRAHRRTAPAHREELRFRHCSKFRILTSRPVDAPPLGPNRARSCPVDLRLSWIRLSWTRPSFSQRRVGPSPLVAARPPPPLAAPRTFPRCCSLSRADGCRSMQRAAHSCSGSRSAVLGVVAALRRSLPSAARCRSLTPDARWQRRPPMGRPRRPDLTLRSLPLVAARRSLPLAAARRLRRPQAPPAARWHQRPPIGAPALPSARCWPRADGYKVSANSSLLARVPLQAAY